MRKSLKKALLPFLDFNNNKKIDWWEYVLAIFIILLIEIGAEIIATILLRGIKWIN